MKTLLVVDDNKGIRDLLSFALAGFLTDCAVKTAQNGAEAVRIFDSSHVDAVLTDVSMPVMDGYRLMEELRARFPRVPVMVMTGEADPSVHSHLKSLGAVRCFEKPFDLYRAAREIGSVLGLADRIHTLEPVTA
jgi:CheY-like chemotaxis protein